MSPLYNPLPARCPLLNTAIYNEWVKSLIFRILCNNLILSWFRLIANR